MWCFVTNSAPLFERHIWKWKECWHLHLNCFFVADIYVTGHLLGNERILSSIPLCLDSFCLLEFSPCFLILLFFCIGSFDDWMIRNLQSVETDGLYILYPFYSHSAVKEELLNTNYILIYMTKHIITVGTLITVTYVMVHTTWRTPKEPKIDMSISPLRRLSTRWFKYTQFNVAILIAMQRPNKSHLVEVRC